jgi:hypothetical protein
VNTVGLSETLLAAMIGATATVGTALFNLYLSWRRQAADRRVSSKGRSRSLVWTLALMFASAVGGFAYSEYLGQGRRDETHALRLELQQQTQTLASSAARLEQVRLNAQTVMDDQTRLAEARRRGVEGVEALVQLPPCKGRVTVGAEHPACAEADAQRVAVCAVIPASAQVTEVQFFTRPEDSQQPWGESRVVSGQDAGSARFLDAPIERANTESTKQVCYNFTHWGGDNGRSARIIVRYRM